MNFGLRHVPSGHLLRLPSKSSTGVLLKAGQDGMPWSSTEPWDVMHVMQLGDENRGAGSLETPLHLYSPDDLELVILSETAEAANIDDYPKPVSWQESLQFPSSAVGSYIRAILQAQQEFNEQAAVLREITFLDPAMYEGGGEGEEEF